MIKRLFILATVIFLLYAVPIAYAGFGVHKAFEKNADTCTGCHRQHAPIQQQLGVETAVSSVTLSQATTEYDFCMSCHGREATGADTDIETGVYDNAGGNYGTFGAVLNGGGFVRVGGPDRPAVTSTHAVDGGSYVPYGSAAAVTMSCTSCHNPDGSSNYRLLRDTVNGVNVAGYVSSNETGFGTESITMPKTPTGFGTYQPNYTAPLYQTASDTSQGMSGWCSSCHSSYNLLQSGTNFHHPVNVPISQNPSGNLETILPLDKASASSSNTDPSNQIECLTCHFAHGTAVSMTELARVEPTRSQPSSGPGYSALLRMDNRGVCENCHQK